LREQYGYTTRYPAKGGAGIEIKFT
jgi:hypothetical protein